MYTRARSLLSRPGRASRSLQWSRLLSYSSPSSFWFILGCVCGCSDRQAASPALELRELSALAIDDTLRVAGLAVNDTVAAILYANSKFVHIAGTGAVSPRRGVQPCSGLPTSAGWASTGELEVLCDAGEEVVRLNDSEGTVLRWRGPSPIFLQSAVLVRDVWLAGGNDSDGSFVVVRLTPPNGYESLASLAPSADGRDSFPVLASLSPVDSSVFVTVRREPFTVIEISPSGRELRRLTPSLPRPSRRSLRDEGWVALGSLMIGNATIEVLADVHGLRRRFAVFDSTGRYLRAATLDAPMVPVVNLPRLRQVVGLRTGRKQELVMYSWLWR